MPTIAIMSSRRYCSSATGAFHFSGENGRAGIGALFAVRHPGFDRVKRTLAVLAFCTEGGKAQN